MSEPTILLWKQSNDQQILSQLYTLKTLKCVRWETNERVTGRKAKGPQAVGGNKLQVAWFFFFLSLHKI